MFASLWSKVKRTRTTASRPPIPVCVLRRRACSEVGGAKRCLLPVRWKADGIRCRIQVQAATWSLNSVGAAGTPKEQRRRDISRVGEGGTHREYIIFRVRPRRSGQRMRSRRRARIIGCTGSGSCMGFRRKTDVRRRVLWYPRGQVTDEVAR
ncbi:hypothetical protein L226DRAFT_152017 [Lentinus tigrinus ALCF2SS1-7]|uniref:uncharacterized protein n=1 Tax=Lentinus tigrinus ALCF2SS1-7 TaxID=1328758 RepID=UPI001165DEB7|nr:hypothetical protein L226DRAFT_152017 [Lentinus tigrinus ALCF2SS1-7]